MYDVIKKVLKFVGHRASVSSLINVLENEFRELDPNVSPQKLRQQTIGSIGGASSSGFIEFDTQKREWVRVK